MGKIKDKPPSPAMVVAITALVFAVAGSALAGIATVSVLSKKEKRQTRKIAKNEISKAAPGLSVASAESAKTANSANTVDGLDAADLLTASGFGEDPEAQALPESFVSVASASITTQSDGRVLASGSAELVGAVGGERARCQIVIDGTAGGEYEVGMDDVIDNSETVAAVNFSVFRLAGTYTAALRCAALSGAVTKEIAAINVYGLGAPPP